MTRGPIVLFTDNANGAATYDAGDFYCELVGRKDRPAAHTLPIRRRLNDLPISELMARAGAAERELYNLGITFTLYSGTTTTDRILPFDLIPRVLSSAEWRTVETGVAQRVQALNLFLHDIYHEQHILNDGTIPRELVIGNANYRPEMACIDLPHKAYVNVSGTDIVRDHEGQFAVLEDNCRTPSGVSYVIENRHMMFRAFPEITEDMRIRPVSNYGVMLKEAMLNIAPPAVDDPQVVLLSPGSFNSAYFEHVLLAREMGVPLVEGRDLFVDEDDHIYMSTTMGPERVDVIYRRINDDFLDPEVFRPDSALGLRGLMRALRRGKVNLANGVGAGVADDKAVYAYVPRVISYYLDEDPILPNIQTNICREKDALAYTLAHLNELVVKPVGEAGGYGITVGPVATSEQIDVCRQQLMADPSNYISQPLIQLSVCPTLIGGQVEPRHVDLRPFAVTSDRTWVLPGGLTRVALPKGSYIVNSSQGGGSKDTWVLA